jgi:sporulation-control protein spo0M
LYFAKPLEYRVEIPRDTFVQGEPLRGTVSVTNRDTQPHKNLSLQVGLAFGVYKELKAEGASTLQVLQRLTLAEGFALKPGQERQADWELPLALDAPIQSKEGGPFLLYGGDLDTPERRGQIDLPVQLAPSLAAFLTTLENHFAFELRGSRVVDGLLEARYKPPASYPTLDELTVEVRLEPKGINVEFLGRGKGLKRGEEGGVAIRTRGVNKVVPVEQFMPKSGLPNRALYRALVDELLPQIAIRVEKRG